MFHAALGDFKLSAGFPSVLQAQEFHWVTVVIVILFSLKGGSKWFLSVKSVCKTTKCYLNVLPIGRKTLWHLFNTIVKLMVRGVLNVISLAMVTVLHPQSWKATQIFYCPLPFPHLSKVHFRGGGYQRQYLKRRRVDQLVWFPPFVVLILRGPKVTHRKEYELTTLNCLRVKLLLCGFHTLKRIRFGCRYFWTVWGSWMSVLWRRCKTRVTQCADFYPISKNVFFL